MDFDTIAKWIQSPPGQIAAGAAFGGIVWKFFKNFGDVLNENTNREIARWIKVQNVRSMVLADNAQSWPGTFAKVFDRVFGEKHLAWKCFRRSCVATFVAFFLSMILPTFLNLTFAGLLSHGFMWLTVIGGTIMVSALAVLYMPLGYLSLLETRYVISLMKRWNHALAVVLLLAVDACVTLVLVTWPTYVAVKISELQPNQRTVDMIDIAQFRLTAQRVGQISSALSSGYQLTSSDRKFLKKFLQSDILNSDTSLLLAHLEASTAELAVLIRVVTNRLDADSTVTISSYFSWMAPPAFFTSIWLWLYAASGFLLKAARRFDLGFVWFNSHFDIDKKPLQSMGIVAGVIAAFVYWAAVVLVKVVV